MTLDEWTAHQQQCPRCRDPFGSSEPCAYQVERDHWRAMYEAMRAAAKAGIAAKPTRMEK